MSPRATYEQELVNAARAVARLQARRRRLRKDLREVDAGLRHERKMLRALMTRRDDDRRPDVMPSRLFGGATGHVRGDEVAVRVVPPADVEPFEIGDPLPVPRAKRARKGGAS